MEIKKHDILRIERLARLKLPADQEQSFSERLTKVFDWIDQLREVDVEGVTPMVTPLIGMRVQMGVKTTPLRHDVVSDGDCRNQIMANAPEAQHGSFTVPKVVE
jgi:aspartyl-tRNA(Asn)/glutamyl-tRNA(Gln) amidotransferase subunit C